MRDQNEQQKIKQMKSILMYLSKVSLLKGKKTPLNLLRLFKSILRMKLIKSLENLDGKIDLFVVVELIIWGYKSNQSLICLGVLCVGRRQNTTASRLASQFARRNANKRIWLLSMISSICSRTNTNRSQKISITTMVWLSSSFCVISPKEMEQSKMLFPLKQNGN